MMKKYLAEFLGTFGLTLAVLLSLSGTFPIPTPAIAALTLGLFVYSLGHISGTHINPAVTIGAWSIGKIGAKDAIGYLIAQFAGASLAAALASALVTAPVLNISNALPVGIAELIGTFFFTLGIASVVYGKTPSEFSGVVVGGSLLLGISLAAGIGSNGVLNPAVALGIGSFNLTYIIGPIIGSVMGMQVYYAFVKE